MFLTVVALLCGYGIGRIRGGRWDGVLSSRLNAQAFLITAIAATLMIDLFTPSFPMFWLMIAFIGFIGFAMSNLAMTGVIVLLIGLLMNLAPVLANWAVPVSELALQSVNDVDASGAASITGIRESTATATTLSFLGDVIPVPIFNKVISIGDLVALVAIADIVVNLMLRTRDRELDAGGVTFAAAGSVAEDDETVIDLRDSKSGPAHAAPGGVKLTPPSPRVRRPAHAIPESPPEREIPPPSPTSRPMFAAEPEAVDDEAVIDLTDRRPIIDLTVSPTDDQLTEFLRRRAEADRRLDAGRHEVQRRAASRRRSLRFGRRASSASPT